MREISGMQWKYLLSPHRRSCKGSWLACTGMSDPEYKLKMQGVISLELLTFFLFVWDIVKEYWSGLDKLEAYKAIIHV